MGGTLVQPLIPCVIYSVWLNTAQYIPYQQLVGTLVQTGKATIVLMPTYVNSMKRTKFMTPYSWDITAYISLEKHLANVSYVLQIRTHRTILHAKLDKMILQYLPYVVRHMPFQVGGMKQIRNIYLGTNHQRV